ncbi:MAG: hypothetical protein WDO24_07435 [Pseudomonadota bacterium]
MFFYDGSRVMKMRAKSKNWDDGLVFGFMMMSFSAASLAFIFLHLVP